MDTTTTGCAPMSPIRRLCRVVAAAALGVLAACGGSSGGGTAEPADLPATRAEAARFLTQATFGPTEGEIERVMAIGYAAWIAEQLALPQTLHRATWDADNAAIKAADA